MSDLQLLLTPRPWGGHEQALLNWLHDAVRHEGLQATILGTDSTMAHACAEAGLGRCVVAGSSLDSASRAAPLLLAPGVLHAQAWRLVRALCARHAVWVYVPMGYRARVMGYRHAALRDALLAPWLRGVRGWITIDDRQADQLRDAWGVRAPVHVLPNCLPLGTGPAAVHDSAAPPGGLRIAYVGRFDAWQKGLDWLAEQLRARADWTLPHRWHFQGAGPAAESLQQLAAALGPHRVQVHAHAPLNDALAASDVLILPSRYEGVPLVALEATARGWPVLASDGAGLQSLLPAASQFGFGDADGLARALGTLAQPAARRAAVAHAQQRLPGLLQAQRYRETLHTLVQAWRGVHAPLPAQLVA